MRTAVVIGATDCPVGSSPQEFGAYIRSEIEEWSKVKVAGIQPN